MSRKIIIVLKIYFHVCDSIQQLLKGSTTIQNFPVAYQKRLYLNVIEGNMKLRSIRLYYFCTFSFHLNSTLIPKTVITNINSCPCRIKNIVSISWDQKQPSRGVLGKRCSENMQQIYRRTPMPKYDFNKLAKQTSAWVLSCKFAAYFQRPFPRSTSRWLLLWDVSIKITSQALFD